jgi:hypothetical protein
MPTRPAQSAVSIALSHRPPAILRSLLPTRCPLLNRRHFRSGVNSYSIHSYFLHPGPAALFDLTVRKAAGSFLQAKFRGVWRLKRAEFQEVHSSQKNVHSSQTDSGTSEGLFEITVTEASMQSNTRDSVNDFFRLFDSATRHELISLRDFLATEQVAAWPRVTRLKRRVSSNCSFV